MNYHNGVVLKIYPSDVQKHIIAVNDGAQRAVYNLFVGVDKEIHRLKKTADIVPADKKRLEDVTLKIRELNGKGFSTAHIRNTLPFLNEPEVDCNVIANAKKNYRAAWKNMRKCHTGVPTFHKKTHEQAYQTTNNYARGHEGLNGGTIRFLGRDHLKLPVIGRIRCSGSPKIIDKLFAHSSQTRIGTVTISRDAVGEYWVSLQIASDDPFVRTLPKTGSQIGIDLNLTDLVNDSESGSFENPRFRKKLEGKLAKAQRKQSRRAEQAKKDNRKLRDSRNYQKQRQKVAYIQRKIARQRADYLNCVSKQLIKSHDLIAAENLKVSNMLKNHCLAKAISDAGWRTLLTLLQQKGEMYGRDVILVTPQYTTQTCSVCGHVMTGDQKLPLSVREWDCPECGTHHMRDTNAAKNILAKALESL
jgi:putative transposase